MEKLPKASLNLTYTMEKFVNQPILEQGKNNEREDEFERDSNTNDLDAMMEE